MAPYQKTNASRRSGESQQQRENALDQVVGLGRLELPTSRLSSARSNQLSYKPLTLILIPENRVLLAQPATNAGCVVQAQAPGACSSAKKEKRRRRNPACRAQQS